MRKHFKNAIFGLTLLGILSIGAVSCSCSNDTKPGENQGGENQGGENNPGGTTENTLSDLKLTGILKKKEYKVGDLFDATGLTVTAVYSDKSEEDVTSKVQWTPSKMTIGTTEVTGTYLTKTVKVTGISVTEKEIDFGKDVTVYLVLSEIGLYNGQPGQDFAELSLENAIKFESTVGAALPGKEAITSTSGAIFSNWMAYEGKGAPTRYDKVPGVEGKILYANFVIGQKIKSLSYTGTLAKTSYDLDKGETFDPTGIKVMAEYEDGSKEDVTASVQWKIKPGQDYALGTYGGLSVQVDGITVTGTVTPDENSYTFNITVPSNWDITDIYDGGAVVYAWAWEGEFTESTWIETTKLGANKVGVTTEKRPGKIIIVRMASGTTTPSWDAKWNQTEDIVLTEGVYEYSGTLS